MQWIKRFCFIEYQSHLLSSVNSLILAKNANVDCIAELKVKAELLFRNLSLCLIVSKEIYS